MWLMTKDIITHYHNQRIQLKKTRQIVEVDANTHEADRKITALIQRINLLKSKILEVNNIIEGKSS